MISSDSYRLLPIFEILACFFGLITNSLSVLVFYKAKFKDISFKYMFVTSFCDLIYLALTLIAEIFVDFERTDESNFSYFQKMYLIWIDDYFTSCLALFCIQIDIVLSLQRYLILLNKSFCHKISYKIIMVVLFIVSLIYYLPVVFFKDIISKYSNETNSTQYQAVKNQLGSSLFGNMSVILMSAFRFFLGIIVLTLINILNSCEFKKRFRNYNSSRPITGILIFI